MNTPAAIALGLLGAVALLGGCGGGHETLGPGQEKVSGEEAKITELMVAAIREASLQRHPQGRVRRFNQTKGLGCLDATFEVVPDLPARLRQGLFATGENYPARLRYANATVSDDSEKDFRGLSIKLSGVDGEPLWGLAGEQDFLLNSYPALFAADPADFLSFVEATRDDKLWRYFINPSHLYSLRLILKGRDKIDNPFAIRYWSTTPYRFGEDPATAVKYSVRPCPGSGMQTPAQRNANFLTDVMAAQLKAGPVCLQFMVQFQGDPASMPVENAAVTWDEQQSPFEPVATITVKDQPFTQAQQVAACESIRFNPWQALAAHRPLGGINRVRKPVYAEIGAFRGQENARRGLP
jgi:catalase